MPDGYYDEEGYWHRDPGPQRAPSRRRRQQPVKDPYYKEYRGQHYDAYGKPVQIRRVVRGPQRRRITTSEMGLFSGAEIKDLSIATVVLAAAFTMMFAGGIFGLLGDLDQIVFLFIIAFISTVTAFTAHEVAHKFMAQKHGMPAEFVLSPRGMMWALVTGAIGFLFALPGAVVFLTSGESRSVIGKVGAAGPATNACLALGFFGLSLVHWPQFFFISFINAWIGMFNMIPYGDFDGLKIWHWNKGIYIVLLIVLLPIVILYFLPYLLSL